MKQLIKTVVFISLFMPSTAMANNLLMKWGLQNTWSYFETMRGKERDGAYHLQKQGKKYRTFAFKNDQTVSKPMLICLNRHFSFWDQYKAGLKGRKGLSKPSRKEFERFKSELDPACIQYAKKQAPVLYFDFVAKSQDQFVLEAIEITTLRFSEYRGGGFFEKEAWYDIVLSHNEGTKRYDVSKKLVFSGYGRCKLRFWSDNYYEERGWITPMGEYMIKITFIFSAGVKKISVSTEPFKIDV